MSITHFYIIEVKIRIKHGIKSTLMTKIWTNEIPTGWVLNTSTYSIKNYKSFKGHLPSC